MQKKLAVTDLNAPNGSRDIPSQSHDVAIFVGFPVSFLHKYDVTDIIQQNNEKMKVQYLSSLLFNLFEILQPVRT